MTTMANCPACDAGCCGLHQIEARGAAAGRPAGIQGKDYEWCEKHNCRMPYREASEMWGCPRCEAEHYAAAGRPSDEAAAFLRATSHWPPLTDDQLRAVSSYGPLPSIAAVEIMQLRAALASAEQRARTAEEAIDAMVILTPQGQPCYRTSNGLPQGMPKKVERIVQRALGAAPTEGRGSDSEQEDTNGRG